MIACLTPLPPAPSGIADFAQDLLGKLRQRTQVAVFDSPEKYQGGFDKILYEIGNNKMHQWIYREALRSPGVVDLHDALLQHLLLGESWDAWEKEFAYTYGERGREIAANLRGGNPASHEGFFRYPLVKRLVESNRRVIVHNRGAESRVRREVPNADVRVIALPFIRRSPATTREQARRELGISPDAFLVGSFGYMRETRLLGETLSVYRQFQQRVPNAAFVLVGEFTAPEQEHFYAPKLTALGVRRPGHVSDKLFETWGVACDVVINLRYPSAGESSGAALRMMGLGVPVMISERAETTDYPDDACLKIPHGEIEEALMLEYMLALVGKPELRRAIGENAGKYVAAAHDPDHIVDQYLSVLE